MDSLQTRGTCNFSQACLTDSLWGESQPHTRLEVVGWLAVARLASHYRQLLLTWASRTTFSKDEMGHCR